MAELGFELTHRCNLAHPLCDHRIAGSGYELSWEDFQHALQFLDDGDQAILVGGEPTLHPQFQRIAEALLMKGIPVHVKTNGARINICPPGAVATLQHYPGENDAIVERWGGEPWVTVNPFTGWWNPRRDPDLGDKRAKAVRLNCSAELRLFGRRLYGCCVSEGIERAFGCGPAWVPMDANWRDWRRIPTWRTCRRCFRAIDRGLL
jgi:hypothetical protein